MYVSYLWLVYNFGIKNWEKDNKIIIKYYKKNKVQNDDLMKESELRGNEINNQSIGQ
jgi:hypothetical protein